MSPAVTDRHSSSSVTTANAPNGPLLSNALEQFIAHKNWRSATSEIHHRATIQLFIELSGDLPIGAYTKAQARDFRKILPNLPPNIKSLNSPHYGQPLTSILNKENDKIISTKTQSDHITRLTGFFNWLKSDFDEITLNPFDGIRIDKRKKSIKREAINQSDINKILGCYIYSNDKWPAIKRGKEASKFWVPLILAFSGCRLNEAAQL